MSKYLYLSLILLSCGSSHKDGKRINGSTQKDVTKLEQKDIDYCNYGGIEPGDTLLNEHSNIKLDPYGEVFEVRHYLPQISKSDLLNKLSECFPEGKLTSSAKQVVLRSMKGQRVVEKSYYLNKENCEYRCRFLPYR